MFSRRVEVTVTVQLESKLLALLTTWVAGPDAAKLESLRAEMKAADDRAQTALDALKPPNPAS